MSVKHLKLHGKYKIPQKATIGMIINSLSVQGHSLQFVSLLGEAVESVGSPTLF